MRSGEYDWQVVRLVPAAAGVLELFKDSLREAGSLPITSLLYRCARALKRQPEGSRVVANNQPSIQVC